MSTVLPSLCPVCGAYSLAPDGDSSRLLAVCDVLVLKALEKVGTWIVRVQRSRHHSLGSRPKHLAHTVWPASDDMVTKALSGAWDVVPALLDGHGCCGVTSRRETMMLDAYVHDLVITGSEHDLSDLAYRMQTQLGLPVFQR